MKANEIKYVWIFTDQYGDMETEFIYPEELEGEIPLQCEKASWDEDGSIAHRYRLIKVKSKSQSKRLDIQIVD